MCRFLARGTCKQNQTSATGVGIEQLRTYTLTKYESVILPEKLRGNKNEQTKEINGHLESIG